MFGTYDLWKKSLTCYIFCYSSLGFSLSTKGQSHLDALYDKQLSLIYFLTQVSMGNWYMSIWTKINQELRCWKYFVYLFIDIRYTSIIYYFLFLHFAIALKLNFSHLNSKTCTMTEIASCSDGWTTVNTA